MKFVMKDTVTSSLYRKCKLSFSALLNNRSDRFLNLLVATIVASNGPNVRKTRDLSFMFLEKVFLVGAKHLMKTLLFCLESSKVLGRCPCGKDGGTRRSSLRHLGLPEGRRWGVIAPTHRARDGRYCPLRKHSRCLNCNRRTRQRSTTILFHLGDLTLERVVTFVKMTDRFLLRLHRHSSMSSRKTHIVLFELLLQFPLPCLKLRQGHSTKLA